MEGRDSRKDGDLFLEKRTMRNKNCGIQIRENIQPIAKDSTAISNALVPFDQPPQTNTILAQTQQPINLNLAQFSETNPAHPKQFGPVYENSPLSVTTLPQNPINPISSPLGLPPGFTGPKANWTQTLMLPNPITFAAQQNSSYQSPSTPNQNSAGPTLITKKRGRPANSTNKNIKFSPKLPTKQCTEKTNIPPYPI